MKISTTLWSMWCGLRYLPSRVRDSVISAGRAESAKGDLAWQFDRLALSARTRRRSQESGKNLRVVRQGFLNRILWPNIVIAVTCQFSKGAAMASFGASRCYITGHSLTRRHRASNGPHLQEKKNTSSDIAQGFDTQNSLKTSDSSDQGHHQRQPWQVQKTALSRKFGASKWSPRKRLSPDSLEGIRACRTNFPTMYTTPVLADLFKVSPEAIRRILKSKWRPSEAEEDRRRERWNKRGLSIWNQLNELGMKPPRKWRTQQRGLGGISDGLPGEIKVADTSGVRENKDDVSATQHRHDYVAASDAGKKVETRTSLADKF